MLSGLAPKNMNREKHWVVASIPVPPVPVTQDFIRMNPMPDLSRNLTPRAWQCPVGKSAVGIRLTCYAGMVLLASVYPSDSIAGALRRASGDDQRHHGSRRAGCGRHDHESANRAGTQDHFGSDRQL